MRFCSGQTRAEFAFFARLRATGGTTNRERFFLCDFHAYTMRGNSPINWSIVTIARSYPRRIIALERVDRQRYQLRSQVYEYRRVAGPSLFLGADSMFNQLAIHANKVSEPPPTDARAPSDSEHATHPPQPEPPYKPYAAEPAVTEAPYEPYAKKRGQEPPYEPYKDI
jgi:hypothetical protein